MYNVTCRVVIFCLIIGICSFGIYWGANNFFQGTFLQALLIRAFPQLQTSQTLRNAYSQRKIKILIVPGHDNEYFGTVFKGLKEADLNLAVAKYLDEYLKQDGHYDVTTTRDLNSGEYTQTFSDYFSNNKKSIDQFIIDKKSLVDGLEDLGLIEDRGTNYHNTAVDTVKYRLYGINKWANDNAIDITLHIHFNDTPRKSGVAAPYDGMAIYIPDDQFPNGQVSNDLAQSIFARLNSVLTKSSLPIENSGVIPTQELIAIGSNATRNTASLLIEYGYIYEPQFQNDGARSLATREVAFQTYLGLHNYLTQTTQSGSAILPYRFTNSFGEEDKDSKNTYALQIYLKTYNMYPPAGLSLADCPLTGVFGDCTKKAVAQFQELYAKYILVPAGLLSGTGYVGMSTVAYLNRSQGI